MDKNVSYISICMKWMDLQASYMTFMEESQKFWDNTQSSIITYISDDDGLL